MTEATMRNGWSAGLVLAALGATAAWGCRCSKSEPGAVGGAESAVAAVPADVNAVLLVNVEGLKQGSLGQFIYDPWVVKQMEEYGGRVCSSLAAERTRAAAIGLRLGGAEAGQQVFLTAEGPSLADVRACVDENARRQGLTSAYEDIAGIRALTDSRGLHVLAAGPSVVARAFPLADLSVLSQISEVAAGRRPGLDTRTDFMDLLGRLDGDLTLALSRTRELFDAYRSDLEEWTRDLFPADACASPAEIKFVLTSAAALGFGNLDGIARVLDSRLAGLEKVCAADALRVALEALGHLQALGATLTGRTDIDLALVLDFDDDAVAADLRGLLADLVAVLGVLPSKLDVIERDWPSVIEAVGKRVNLSNLRAALRSPVLRGLSVAGTGRSVELRVKIERSDVRGAIEAVQRLVARAASSN